MNGVSVKIMTIKLSALFLLSFAAPAVSAADFFIGYKSEMNESYFKSNITVKRIFTTLDIVEVDAASLKDLDYLKLDPNISFVQEDGSFEAPQKFISKPHPTSNKFLKSSASPVKPIGIELVKADKVWDKFTEGEGVRVAVLDSGIDINHQDLSTNIEKARNFLTNDPNDFVDISGHGTHVAGTIAASGSLLGVAPKVKILAGKVCNTACGFSAILQGVEWAIKEKVDIVNMSLGGPNGMAMARQVYKKAEAANIVVIAASGNDGEMVDSFPASYPEVFSVGAVDKNLVLASFSNWSNSLDIVAPGVEVYSSVPKGSGREAFGAIQFGRNQRQEVKLKPMTGSGVDDLSQVEVVDAGLGLVTDFANINVRGKIALMKRGEITFKEKHDHAIAEGAVAVVVYNNVDEELTGTLGEDTESDFVAVGLNMKLGEKLVQLLKKEKVIADLSVEATDYQNNNGTSMASPHVAGVAALMKAANPKLTATQIKTLLKSTATATTNPTPERYGRGFVNALKAVTSAQGK